MREDVGKMRHGMRKPGEAQICFTRLLLTTFCFHRVAAWTWPTGFCQSDRRTTIRPTKGKPPGRYKRRQSTAPGPSRSPADRSRRAPHQASQEQQGGTFYFHRIASLIERCSFSRPDRICCQVCCIRRLPSDLFSRRNPRERRKKRLSVIIKLSPSFQKSMTEIVRLAYSCNSQSAMS